MMSSAGAASIATPSPTGRPALRANNRETSTPRKYLDPKVRKDRPAHAHAPHTDRCRGGFRCEWRAETYAAFRSVLSTAKANGASVLQTVWFVLSAPQAGKVLAGVG